MKNIYSNKVNFKDFEILVLALIIFFHFVLSIIFSQNVYQECDSDQVYFAIMEFPHSVKSYISWGYVDAPLSNFFKDLRLKYLDFIADYSLSYPIKSALALAWATTYSPGVGLLYGLVTNPTFEFEMFLKYALYLNILIVHICAVLIYLTLKNLHINKFTALLLPIIFLFSYSVYSYQYHMGSTIWNICTGVVFMYAYTFFYENKKYFDRFIPIISGVLLFFNYLIVIYWASYFAARILDLSKKDEFGRNFINLTLSNLSFWASLFLIVLFFYQPNTGVRGGFNDGNLYANIYYISLNFISIYNESFVLNVVQFILFLFLILLGIVIVLKQSITALLNDESSVYSFIVFFAIIYSGFVWQGLLSIAPSRHVMFLIPVIYIVVGIALDIFKNINFRSLRFLVYTFSLLLVPTLFYSMFHRNNQIINNVNIALSEADEIIRADFVLTYDCSYNIIYSSYLSEIPKIEFNSLARLPVKAGSYLYISQTGDLDIEFLKQLPKIEIIAITKLNKITDGYRFLPYSPNNYPHDRPNNIFLYLIKLRSVVDSDELAP
jgi:hypothetical protein